MGWNSTTMKSKVHRDSLWLAHLFWPLTLLSSASHWEVLLTTPVYLWAQVHTVTYHLTVSVSFIAGTQMESRIVAKHHPSVQLLPNNIRGTFPKKLLLFRHWERQQSRTVVWGTITSYHQNPHILISAILILKSAHIVNCRQRLARIHAESDVAELIPVAAVPDPSSLPRGLNPSLSYSSSCMSGLYVLGLW